MPNLHVTDAKIMVADEVVETPYAVCRTAVLTVELIGNSKYANLLHQESYTRHCFLSVASSSRL